MPDEVKNKDVAELLKWLHCLPNSHLQLINSKTNEILVERYTQELRQQNEYAANMSAALSLLGEKQTKHTKLTILDKLEKTTGVHCKFDKLINKIKRSLSDD